MICPSCGSGRFSVVETREPSGGTTVHRRRLCRSCGHRATTMEVTANSSAHAALSIALSEADARALMGVAPEWLRKVADLARTRQRPRKRWS